MSNDEHQHEHQHTAEPHGADKDWDEHYGAGPQIWSGNPNSNLVAEVTDLSPGRVLDVGCGEGADAIWLAEQGWQVTALDVSAIALDRARAAAKARDVEVDWRHTGLLEAGLAAESFDLVTSFYPAIPIAEGAAVERELQRLVAPGGTLLFAHHLAVERPEYVLVDAVESSLRSSQDDAGIEWDVTRETRVREIDGGGGAHHHDDDILRATRR